MKHAIHAAVAHKTRTEVREGAGANVKAAPGGGGGGGGGGGADILKPFFKKSTNKTTIVPGDGRRPDFQFFQKGECLVFYFSPFIESSQSTHILSQSCVFQRKFSLFKKKMVGTPLKTLKVTRKR